MCGLHLLLCLCGLHLLLLFFLFLLRGLKQALEEVLRLLRVQSRLLRLRNEWLSRLKSFSVLLLAGSHLDLLKNFELIEPELLV